MLIYSSRLWIQRYFYVESWENIRICTDQQGKTHVYHLGTGLGVWGFETSRETHSWLMRVHNVQLGHVYTFKEQEDRVFRRFIATKW